jgi:hypothetical protein
MQVRATRRLGRDRESRISREQDWARSAVARTSRLLRAERGRKQKSRARLKPAPLSAKHSSALLADQMAATIRPAQQPVRRDVRPTTDWGSRSSDRGELRFVG